MVERPGLLNAEEKQLAKRYAVFFRMPRLSVNSPTGSQGQTQTSEVGGMSLGDPIQYLGEMMNHQQPNQPLDDYAQSVSMSDQGGLTNFALYGQQQFSNIPPDMYDGQNDLDFGFSEFFGGYQDQDFTQPPLS
jgi:hypothetical protein